MSAKVIGLIPARWASEEIKNKIIQNIGEKPMIQWVFERAAQSPVLDDLLVATDHEKIASVVMGFGGKTVMTSPDHKCGTDRVAEAYSKLGQPADIVVNIQGDEPFVEPAMIGEVVSPLLADKSLQMATLSCQFASDEEFQFPFNVKVVSDLRGNALYFSRAPIPFPRNEDAIQPRQHIGIYAYRTELLELYPTLSSPLEDRESLEQLRALENGYNIRVVPTKTDYAKICINTYEDMEKARLYLENLDQK